MKKILSVIYFLTIACFLPASNLHAQTVSIYGSLDTGFERINNVGTSGNSITRMPTLTGGQLPSRIGFRGTEDLGGGYKALFTLENGFAVDSGTALQNGRLFGRQAFVGIAGPYGQLTLGRQWSMIFYSLLLSDWLGGGGFSIASLDSYLPSARADNAIAYQGTFGKFMVGATYSLGRDTQSAGNCSGESAANSKACRAWSAIAKYDSLNWGAAVAYDIQKGGSGATDMNVVPGTPGIAFQSPNDEDLRLHYSGYFKFADGRLGFGLIDRSIRTQLRAIDTQLYYAGITYPIQNWTIDGQVGHIRNASFNANSTIVIGRVSYNLSKRTAIYGLLSRVNNSGAGATYSVSGTSVVPASPPAGRGQTGTMVGIRHVF